MGFSIGSLGFQPAPDQTNAIDSSVDSVASGIQSAAKTSGPAEVSDWLETYSTSLPPGTAANGNTTFATAAAVQSPAAYLSAANKLGGADALKSFSNLVPMDQVAGKLEHSSFQPQKSLAGFSDALTKLEAGFRSAFPATHDHSSGLSEGKRTFDEINAESHAATNAEIPKESNAKDIPPGALKESQAAVPMVGLSPTESQARESPTVGPSASESAAAIPYIGLSQTESQAAVGRESEAKAAVHQDSQAAIPLVGEGQANLSSVMFIGDVQNARMQDASAVATLGDGTQHSVLQEARVFDRLSSFAGTVQGLVDLNQQMKVK